MPEVEEIVEDEVIVEMAPWEIEADHPRNADLLLQTIPGTKLRSAIDGSKTSKDRKTGLEGIPVDQAVGMAAFPRTPGMRVLVDPYACTYRVSDTLEPHHLAAIQRYFQSRSGMVIDSDLRGMPTKTGKLMPDQIKTLCREMVWLVEAGEAKRVSGPKVGLEDVDKLPGRYLLNPGSRIRNSQPRYEDEFDTWVSNLDRVGG